MHAVLTETLKQSRPRKSVLNQVIRNSSLCLGILLQIVSLGCRVHAVWTEALSQSRPTRAVLLRVISNSELCLDFFLQLNSLTWISSPRGVD